MADVTKAHDIDKELLSYLDREEGIIGVEDEEIIGEDSIINPFDPTLIRVDTKAMTIDLLIARMKEHELELMPDFQRKAGIWKDEAKSKLIESILIRIPLPAFYMDATDDDKWIIVDGLQRLTTLKRFVIDKDLRLCGLEFLTQLQGKTYDELPRNFQRRILETQIIAYLISRGTPPEVRFNIFKRINTGGLPLSAQEIRHALNQGSATRLLLELARSTEFKQATDNGVPDDRMADREFVLRFLAFTITPYSEYRASDLDRFLNEAMVAINKMTSEEIADLRQQFFRTMRAATNIFGRNAFRKRYSLTASRRPVNRPLFEAWAVNLNRLTDKQLSQLVSNKEDVLSRFVDLMNKDRDFDTAISQGTGDVNKVRLRFLRIEELIREVLT